LVTEGTAPGGRTARIVVVDTSHFSDAYETELGRLPEKLRRFFLSRGVRTEDDARDLAQETLLRVLQRISRGERMESHEAYALGVAKNVFFEYCRRVAKANTHDGLSGAVDLAGVDDPLSDVLISSQALRFRRALQLLPDRMRDLLVKRFVEEVPSRTIAREEGITTDAVDMRVYRAKRELKKRMEKEKADKEKALPDGPRSPGGGGPA
jgi:RNA polymerase sigma-70 factor, ECF subfamily